MAYVIRLRPNNEISNEQEALSMLRSLRRASMLGCRGVLAVVSANRSPISLSGRLSSKLRFIGYRSPGLGVPKGFQTRSARTLVFQALSSSASSSSIVQPMSIQECEGVGVLPGINDDYGGVFVEMKEQMEPTKFASSLRLSMWNWTQQGKRGIWIKLPIKLANLVQLAVEEGFWYHHAEPSYLMVVYWIPATQHTLPINATHRVGVGAFVLNDKREVLAVQEKSGRLRGTGIWKFPTGVVEQGEDIHNGVIREVKEETGIDTEFVEVLAFRQSHKAFFEKSDLFFVCLLRPLSFDIQKQESEIEAAQWMAMEEFKAQPFVQKHELVQYMVNVGLAKMDRDYAGFSPVCITSAFTDQKSYLYLNKSDLNKS